MVFAVPIFSEGFDLEEEKMLTLKNVQNRKESKSPDFLYGLAIQCTVTFDN